MEDFYAVKPHYLIPQSNGIPCNEQQVTRNKQPIYMDIAVTCPQCGAEVDLAEEDTVFKCLYCGSTLKPTGRNQVQSFFISPRENARKVGEALLRALKGKDVRGRRSPNTTSCTHPTGV